MKRLVLVRHQRFEKHRRRGFSVAVWKIVKGFPPKSPRLWGPELQQAWKALEAAE